MKHGVVLAGPRTGTKNIGDYIQSLAQIQFTGEDYFEIERERISTYAPPYDCRKDKVKVIMNGWWMWDSDFWPPSPFVEPLLISMHISPLAANKMLSPDGIDYFRVHQPIGCRDFGTVKLLQQKGIDCYFSACLTLTLGRKYENIDNIRNAIIFCDPFIPRIRKHEIRKLVLLVPDIFSHLLCIFKLSRISYFKQYLGNGHLAFEGRIKSRIRGFVNALSFVSIYSTKYDSKLLLSAEYISNLIDARVPQTHKSLLKLAEERVMSLSKARLVVTSRIHCALPCIGLKTPTIFIMHEEMNHSDIKFNTPGRFDGITDFFRILSINNNSLVSDDEVLNNIGTISTNTAINNKSGWEQYEDALYQQCVSFMESC